jgi:hypothetical protein
MTTAPTISPAKQAKADAIARTVAIVSNHFGADPMAVGRAKPKVCQRGKTAREIVWHHLHACGMSWRAIGNHWERSVKSLSEGARLAVLKLNDADRAMMASLPQIPTTLEISKTEGTAV